MNDTRPAWRNIGLVAEFKELPLPVCLRRDNSLDPATAWNLQLHCDDMVDDVALGLMQS